MSMCEGGVAASGVCRVNEGWSVGKSLSFLSLIMSCLQGIGMEFAGETEQEDGELSFGVRVLLCTMELLVWDVISMGIVGEVESMGMAGFTLLDRSMAGLVGTRILSSVGLEESWKIFTGSD